MSGKLICLVISHDLDDLALFSDELVFIDQGRTELCGKTLDVLTQVFEKEGFAKGTKEIFKAIADSDAFSLLGGGHTSAAISDVGMDKGEMDHVHVSLAGGAFLRYLLGKPLPGIEVLKKR